MKLKLEFYGCLCSTEKFVINGVFADVGDFGCKEDLNPEDAPDYGCGNMSFVPRLPTKAVLDRYSITVDEYQSICEKLADGLHFGRCSWCA